MQLLIFSISRIKTSSNESLEVAYLIKTERSALLTKSLKVLSMNTMSMEKIGEVFPGQSRFAYLSSDKIVKEEASSYSSKKEETEEKDLLLQQLFSIKTEKY